MRKLTYVLIVVGLIAAASPIAGAATVQEIVNQISAPSFQNFLMNSIPTHLTDNRAFNMGAVNHVIQHGAQHDQAGSSIYTAFRRSGWLTQYDPFSYTDDSGNTWAGKNVIAVKQGTTRPDDVYIIASHYDSTANRDTNFTYAPGGDDNGSGVAGLMEMARVLAPYAFDATIVFAAFDGEECSATVGGTAIKRLGSMHYSGEHINDNILGMISLDMMSWNDGSNTGRLETGYSQNGPINAAVTSALQTYGGLGVYTNNSKNYSDHVSFADKGFQALMLIENNWPNNPNYHRQTDSVDTANYIDYTYGTKMVKGVTGYLLNSALTNPSAGAQFIPEPGSALALATGIMCLCGYIRRKKAI